MVFETCGLFKELDAWDFISKLYVIEVEVIGRLAAGFLFRVLLKRQACL